MNLRQTNKANRQKRIVANAARFFSSIGYDLTAIEMVAERSNVSPATIYNNFENKIGLLLAVFVCLVDMVFQPSNLGFASSIMAQGKTGFRVPAQRLIESKPDKRISHT